MINRPVIKNCMSVKRTETSEHWRRYLSYSRGPRLLEGWSSEVNGGPERGRLKVVESRRVGPRKGTRGGNRKGDEILGLGTQVV